MANSAEWSVENHLNFLSLRLDDCNQYFKDLISKLCSPDRKNFSAQLALLAEIDSLNNRIDVQTDNIKKMLQDVRAAGSEDPTLAVVGVWEKKIVIMKTALSAIKCSLDKVVNAEGDPFEIAAELAGVIATVDYNALNMEVPFFDPTVFQPITFVYLRERFDHCLCLLQNIVNNLFQMSLNQSTASDTWNLIKAFNNDFELQKQNISIYENQLYENLSFRDQGDSSVETELNQLASFGETIDIWSTLPLSEISGLATVQDVLQGRHHSSELHDKFMQINYAALGLEVPDLLEIGTLKRNLAWFRPKFETKKLFWVWVNKFNLATEALQEEPEDESSGGFIPDGAIDEYYSQLETFIKESETSIDNFIETLLTCDPDQAVFNEKFTECQRLQSVLSAQRGQMRALRNKLANGLDEFDQASFQPLVRVREWINLVEIWIRVLGSLTGLLSHFHHGSGDGSFDDIVERLRETIERDLFIPTNSEVNGAAPPGSNNAQMEQ